VTWPHSATRLLALSVGWVLSAQWLSAQSVSPPIAEYQERARSSFQLQNASIFPITVVLEVRGFTITDHGDVVEVPLDTSRVHVKLSEMSFRLAPRASHTVFYEATSDSLPTWFNILSAMSGVRTSNGLNVRILLPHVVYLNQKQPLRREEVAIKAFEYDPAAKKAWVQLENLGPHLGRVQQVTISDGRNPSATAGGFPLLPHRLRRAMVSWDGATAPTRLSLRFSRFSIDTTLTPIPASLAADSAAGTPRP
jgi:hypothetical protein